MIGDPFGKACLARFRGKKNLRITVHSDHSEDDDIPVDHLFRRFEQMPVIEQVALQLSKGNVLDVGAGAGCHSNWLIKNDLNVYAIDISPGAIEVLKSQFIPCSQVSFFDLKQTEQFDTILMLMNGTGLAGTLENFPKLLHKVDKLLSPGGQLLIDSSDIIYLFEEEDGSYLLPIDQYYGDVEYQMEFEGEKTNWFKWVYMSYPKLAELAASCGFVSELIIEGEHYDYLSRLTKKTS